MLAQINLIPQKRGQAINSPLSRTLQRFAIVLALIVVVLGIAGGAFLYIRNQELTTREARRDELKNEVLLLQQNEGQLVLLKDRLQKAQTILADRGQYKSLEFFNTFVESFSGRVQIVEVSIEQGINKLTVHVDDSIVLSQVVSQLEESTDYPNITVENIGYRSTIGYTLVISIL